MALVWLAERADGAYERELALKIPLDATPRHDVRDRFRRERDVLARLEHAYIARFYDAGVDADGTPYLAMEYVDGRQVTEACAVVPLQQRVRTFLQVLEAVQYAHDRGVLHRDIKPSNILVTGAGEARLLDFGVAGLLDPTAATLGITAWAGPACTPEYASPELLMGRPADRASDVYSLGVVLYEILAGSRPYDMHECALEGRVAASEPPSQRLTRSGDRTAAAQLRSGLDAIVMKALAPAPTERYASAGAMAQDLRQFLDGMSQQGVRAERGRPARQQLRPIAAGALLAALVVAVLVGWGPGRRLPPVREPPATSPPTVLLLPFGQSASGKDGFLAVGIVDEIARRLGEHAVVRIITVPQMPGNQHKPAVRDAGELARQLGATHVLIGRLRDTGDPVRVEASLLDARSGARLWSRSWTRDGAAPLQVEREIEGGLVAYLHLSRRHVDAATSDGETAIEPAHEHFLLGRYYSGHYDHADFQRAQQELRKAVALDPSYALALAELATTEWYLADDSGDAARARQALAIADRAVVLAPEVAGVYQQRASIRAEFLWDWAGAQADLDLATALDPDSPGTLSMQEEMLLVRGDLDGARTVLRRLIDRDPLTSYNWQALSTVQRLQGDAAQALASARHAAALAPGADRATRCLVLAMLANGDARGALELAGKIRFAARRITALAMAQWFLGNRAQFQELLNALRDGYAASMAYQLAQLHALAGERDRAFEWLDRALRQHDGGLYEILTDRMLDPLRSDSRFADVLARLRLDPVALGRHP